MHITIPQPQFLKHLQMVERAVNDRSTLPILANVLLETTEQELILTATDLDVGIQCRFPLTAPIERGAVALPARKLTTIVRELPDETMVLEAKKNHTATLSCGTSNFRIPGLPAEDFPALPTQNQGEGMRIPQHELKRLITQTAHAMSMEETRFILNGALLTAQKHTLTMVATDGRRLAISTTALHEAIKEPFQAVIPAKTVRELGRLLQDDDVEEVVITALKDNQLALRFGAVTVVTRLIEGQFPAHEKVVPAPSKQGLTCDRTALINATRRASLMTTAASQAIIFELQRDRMTVLKESPELGSVSEEVAVSYTGEPMSIAFNPEFWLDVLRVLPIDDVMVELTGPERPAVIRQPDFLYLVLPMKIA